MQRILPLTLQYYSRSIRISWRGFGFLAFGIIRWYRERIIPITCTIPSEKNITLPGAFFWMPEMRQTSAKQNILQVMHSLYVVCLIIEIETICEVLQVAQGRVGRARKDMMIHN